MKLFIRTIVIFLYECYLDIKPFFDYLHALWLLFIQIVTEYIKQTKNEFKTLKIALKIKREKKRHKRLYPTYYERYISKKY